MSTFIPNYSFYPQNRNSNYQLSFPNAVINNIQQMIAPLKECRIIQRKLVYFIGLSSNLIQKESELKSFEYFGQYGKIVKLVINKNKPYNTDGPNGPSFTCYVTYSDESESSLAILAMENSIIDNHIIKASYGTTKYCLNFLRNSVCKNKNCIFLHYFADEKDISSREKMNNDKEMFNEQRIKAIQLSKILTNEKYQQLLKLKDKKTIFPNCFSVYSRELVQKYISEQNLKPLLCFDISETSPSVEKSKKEEPAKNVENEKKEKESYGKKYNIISYNFKKNHKLFEAADVSRFDFVNKDNKNAEEIPKQINEFLTEQFTKRSILYNKEKMELNDYYFSLKEKNSLDSNDSWSSLVSTLKMWNDFNENDNPNGDVENCYVSVNKFKTY